MLGTQEYHFNALERLAANILKMGPIPNHIAIILDGNRRYARKAKLGKDIEGHKLGLKKLDEVCHMLLELGVKETTLYIFSIENFKRSQEEVDGIMDLLAGKAALTEEKTFLTKKHGIRIEFIGNLEQAPTEGLRTVLKQNMVITKDHNRIKVNLAFIYTGRNEITTGVNTILQGVQKGQVDINHVTPELVRELFTMCPTSPVDLLIRTSGECRLSDFVLWGSTEAHLEFVGEMWPQFTFWGLLGAIFKYQTHIFRKAKVITKHNGGDAELDSRSKEYVRSIRESRWNELNTAVTETLPQQA